MLSPSPVLLARLLDVIENDIVPLTEAGVAAGNKIFGAALLRKCDLSLVLAETNNETENPLWHGEVHLIKSFYEREDIRAIPTKDLIFLSTHEPCTMCMSAITWAGFDNFCYFFSHEDSRDSFSIPHDLRILREVFGLEPGGYNHENAYWKSADIPALVAALPDAEAAPLNDRATRVRACYDRLSAAYQAGKADNDIPLA